jgi:SAM-dependent methyltransferase
MELNVRDSLGLVFEEGAPGVRSAALLFVGHGLENSSRSLRQAVRRRDKPSIFGPNYLHLFTLARAVRTFLEDQGGRIVDLGADESPYRPFLKKAHTYIRLDLNGTCRPDIVGDIGMLPLQTESADVIICTQAAECVDDPRSLVAECHRVLKPGGTIVFSVPFFWPNQPTPETDNYRFTLGSLRRLFVAFRTVEVQPNGNSWLTLAQVASRCVYQTIGTAGMPLYPVLNILGRCLDKLPTDSWLTTGYTVRAMKPR